MDDRIEMSRRRQRLLDEAPRTSPILPSDAPADGKNDLAEPDRSRVRLTKSQQRLLVRILAVNDDLREVRAVLAEEYPDFPLLADRSLRWWRQRIENGEFVDEVAEARARVLRFGLALRPVRIEMLRAHYRRLTARESQAIDTATWLAISREKLKILQQIAAETGEWEPNRPSSGTAAKGVSDEAPENTAEDLSELLDTIVEDRVEMRMALAGAKRPITVAE